MVRIVAREDFSVIVRQVSSYITDSNLQFGSQEQKLWESEIKKPNCSKFFILKQMKQLILLSKEQKMGVLDLKKNFQG